MHMADALISPAVGMALNAVSAAAIGLTVVKIKKEELGEKKIPIIGVAGALVFVGQMINFSIPLTGASGHIGGGILLAGLLGGAPAFISISAVLIIQCLFFADGGLLALGCNIFNIGLIPCLIVYPLIFKPLLKGGLNYKRLFISSVISVIIGLQCGAFFVVVQTWLSGITTLPFGVFTALMLPIHLVIGFVEGVATAAALCFVYKMRPEIISIAQSGGRLGGVSTQKVLIALVTLTVVIGGGLAIFASTNPDGLEWAVEKATSEPRGAETETKPLVATNEGAAKAETEPPGAIHEGGAEVEPETEPQGAIHDGAAGIQKKTALLPDYAFASDPNNTAGITVSGIVGATVTFALACSAGLIITLAKKAKNKTLSLNSSAQQDD